MSETIEQRILGAMARTRVERERPAAILSAINETHILVERSAVTREMVAEVAAEMIAKTWNGYEDDEVGLMIADAVRALLNGSAS